MAKSGTYVKTGTLVQGGQLSVYFDWTIASQSVEDNTSTLDWTLSFLSEEDTNIEVYPYYAGGSYQSGGVRVKINGEIGGYISGSGGSGTPTPSITLQGGVKKVVLSGSSVVQHSSTDYEELKVFVACEIASLIWHSGVGSWVYPGSPEYYSGDGLYFNYSDVIDYIVRYATITSAPHFTDEDNPTITYSNPAGEYAAELQAAISFTGGVDDITYRDIPKTGTSYTFNLTDAERAVLWAKLNEGLTSTTVRFYIRSRVPVHDGSTYETHWDYLTRELTFINYRPTLSPTAIDVNADTLAVTGNNQVLVRYMSNVQYNTGAEARKGASIINQYVSNGDITAETSTGIIEAITSNTFYFGVTDSRNYSERDFISFSGIGGRQFIEYVKPTCNIKVGDLNSSGEATINIFGKYFGGSFGLLDNILSVEYLIYKVDDTETDTWSSLGIITPDVDENNNYTYTFTLSGLDYTSRYKLFVRVSDRLVESNTTLDSIILSATPLFDWGPSDFRFNIPVTIREGDCYGVHILHNSSTGGVVTLSDEIKNYKYLEIFYSDNNGRLGGVTKVPVSLDASGEAITMTVCLSITEASSATSTYIRRTAYICSGTQLSPTVDGAGYVWINGTSVSHVTGTNSLRITRVLGYK